MSSNSLCSFLSTLSLFVLRLGVNYETDFERIIALSTLRQLGLIIRSLSIGLKNLAFFHLLIHALFLVLSQIT